MSRQEIQRDFPHVCPVRQQYGASYYCAICVWVTEKFWRLKAERAKDARWQK